jgi:nucleoside-diphosphate-sugar epimerase
MENILKDDLDYILHQTGDIWKELRGQKVFITGGTGFFGCWLLESFCWANRVYNLNAEAWVLTRNPEAFQKRCPHLANDESITLYKGDVVDFEFPQGVFSFIVHAATEASATLNENYPLKMFDTIVQGTRRTLDFAIQAKTKKFLLTSSGTVYGKQPSEMEHIPEDYMGAPDTMNPHWAYGEGKRCAELLCSTYSKFYNVETKIARCFAFVGPYLPLNAHFAIGNFIRDGLNGNSINVNGDGTPYRSYLYASDLTVWLWTILFKGKNCRPYNVGSDQAISIKDLAEKISLILNNDKNVSISKEVVDTTIVERYVPLVECIKKDLNMAPGVSLNEAITKTASWNNTLNKVW